MASLQAFASSLLPRAWSLAQIPFPFPFEHLPRRLLLHRFLKEGQHGQPSYVVIEARENYGVQIV